jgi:peptidoglycan biosynthesis protein MviN/MurJ (putative lipid II flippase)
MSAVVLSRVIGYVREAYIAYAFSVRPVTFHALRLFSIAPD